MSYTHPNLEKALGETLGVILYQEQVLRASLMTWRASATRQADGFRHAMTHDRTNEEMEKMRISLHSIVP